MRRVIFSIQFVFDSFPVAQSTFSASHWNAKYRAGSRRGPERGAWNCCCSRPKDRLFADVGQQLSHSVNAVEGQVLREVARECEVQRPSHRDAELFLKRWKLGEVDGPPEPPSGKAREAHAKYLRNSSAVADGCELAHSREAERRLL